MSEAKHTPGPWSVGQEDEFGGVPFIEIEAGQRVFAIIEYRNKATGLS